MCHVCYLVVEYRTKFVKIILNQNSYLIFSPFIKVLYITATLPFILMLVLLIRVAQLDGAYKGVEYYLKPDFSRLGSLEVSSIFIG